MDFKTVQDWIDLIARGSALYAGILAALYTYTKFVLERFPTGTEFDLECKTLGHNHLNLMVIGVSFYSLDVPVKIV